jgi:hypothetical protein
MFYLLAHIIFNENNEFGRMWRKAVMGYYEVLSLHLMGRTKVNHKKYQKTYVSGLRFIHSTSFIRNEC